MAASCDRRRCCRCDDSHAAYSRARRVKSIVVAAVVCCIDCLVSCCCKGHAHGRYVGQWIQGWRGNTIVCDGRHHGQRAVVDRRARGPYGGNGHGWCLCSGNTNATCEYHSGLRSVWVGRTALVSVSLRRCSTNTQRATKHRVTFFHLLYLCGRSPGIHHSLRFTCITQQPLKIV